MAGAAKLVIETDANFPTPLEAGASGDAGDASTIQSSIRLTSTQAAAVVSPPPSTAQNAINGGLTATAGTTGFTINTQADLFAAIAAINLGGASSAPNTSYAFTIAASLTLTADIPAIDLAAGDTLLISSGASNPPTISGRSKYHGFAIDAGAVSFADLSLANLTAPGGTGGAPNGGALYIANGANVVTNGVTFNGDTATGAGAAGGAVFVAEGGSYTEAGGSISGAGSEIGSAIFSQGSTVTLDNTTVAGTVADLPGSAASGVIVQGAVTLASANAYTGGTTIDGTLTLAAKGAAGSGPLTFSPGGGGTLVVGYLETPTNPIDGFVVNQTAGWSGSDVPAAAPTMSTANTISIPAGC
jgi:hypothetical protein